MYQLYFDTTRVCINSSFSDILMVLKNPRFKSCERILVENILDTFCIAQTWCDHSILRMLTLIKCSGYTNFSLSKYIKDIFS